MSRKTRVRNRDHFDGVISEWRSFPACQTTHEFPWWAKPDAGGVAVLLADDVHCPVCPHDVFEKMDIRFIAIKDKSIMLELAATRIEIVFVEVLSIPARDGVWKGPK